MKIRTENSPFAEYLTNVHILLLSNYNKLLSFCYCNHMDPDMHYNQAWDGQNFKKHTPYEVTHSPRSRFQQVGEIKKNILGRITFIFIYCTIILLYSLYKNKKNGDRVEKWIARKERISST